MENIQVYMYIYIYICMYIYIYIYVYKDIAHVVPRIENRKMKMLREHQEDSLRTPARCSANSWKMFAAPAACFKTEARGVLCAN